jgi:hypothetical protein
MAGSPPPGRCPLAWSCSLFQRFSLKSSLEIWRQNYCEGPFERCARYQASLARRPIPDLLLPNGKKLKVGY